jgi:hypothetical protein
MVSLLSPVSTAKAPGQLGACFCFQHEEIETQKSRPGRILQWYLCVAVSDYQQTLRPRLLSIRMAIVGRWLGHDALASSFGQATEHSGCEIQSFRSSFSKPENWPRRGLPSGPLDYFVHTNLVAEILCKAYLLEIDRFGNMIYVFWKIALLQKQVKKAKVQRQIRELSKQIKSYF